MLAIASVALLATPASAVDIDWVTVGDPGNACEEQRSGCFGAVPYTYRISRTEVTNAQYVEFLNAVGATDPSGLYNPEMAGEAGSISRNGIPGSFTYAAAVGRGDLPVNYVSFYDALRFTNWLHNGQPVGAYGGATTENGAYTITESGVAGNSIERNAGAVTFLTSEDEWYKAAYYDAGSGGYFDYPAGSDVPTTCSAPTASPNHANCYLSGFFAAVGSYPGSASPYGTFDQGGNISEWTEGIYLEGSRVSRGGAVALVPSELAARSAPFGSPHGEHSVRGFRVASIPEPGTGLLFAAIGLTMAAHCSRRGRHRRRSRPVVCANREA